MKKSYTLVFLVCVILCLGLTVSLANKVENSGVNFEDGNVNLERGYIYLFESITLPRIEWGEVENYETNDNNAAKNIQLLIRIVSKMSALLMLSW